MSGSFNQDKKDKEAVAKGAGWQVFEPSKTGKFDKYKNQIVVIISVGKSKKGNKLYLTEAVYQALGKPEHIQIATRNSNVALIGVEESDKSYKVAQHAFEEGVSGLRFLNLQAFVNKYNIGDGVYDAHLENGMVVFDMSSPPSRP